MDDEKKDPREARRARFAAYLKDAVKAALIEATTETTTEKEPPARTEKPKENADAEDVLDVAANLFGLSD